MDTSIERARESALKVVGATPEQVEKGLELHKRLFASDLFGFLPRTLSAKAHATITEMIGNGAAYAELSPVYDVLRANSHIYDPDCREQFVDAVRATGLNCTVLTAGSEKSLHHSIHRISWYIHLFDTMGDSVKKATCVADIEAIHREGKLAVVCSTNCAPAQSGLTDGMDAHYWIDIFYRLGIRIMHLTYNRRNWVGDGCLEPADGGLSLHGVDVVKHLSRIGMAVDTAHSGRRTTLDAARLSKAPIMATHTACQALYDHPRGKSDDELKAIADTGGLVGICCIPYFLGENGGLKDLLDHIDYAIHLIGTDHVAIGTDTTYVGPPPPGLPPIEGFPKASPYSADRWFGAWKEGHLQPKPEQHLQESLAWTNWPYFTVGLVARGYSECDIEKMLGKNLLRVLAEVENAAESPA